MITQVLAGFWDILLTRFSDLFTNRQMVALTSFTDQIAELHARVLKDSIASGCAEGASFLEGGTEALARADSIVTLVALAVSRLADWSNSLCRWESTGQVSQQLFAQQSIPMTWDFSEANTLGVSSGSFAACVKNVASAIGNSYCGIAGHAFQADAVAAIPNHPGALVTTDPPYYDNIGYSDLSDFFYVWIRRALGSVYPSLLGTILVPKASELVANPYRHGGTDGARKFFEEGFRAVFAQARDCAPSGYPTIVYYAFKQAERAAGDVSSTGWETLLQGMIAEGWAITATWPMNTEGATRMIAGGANALASSIVLAMRPRSNDATIIDRRTLTAELRTVLPSKLRELQQGSIAAVDLPQAAIGPGMAVFSQYAKVVGADGSSMTVRSALQVINQILGEVLSAQEGDFDSGTRWCVKWFESNGFDQGLYGDAETLASAYNTSVKGLERSGALTASAGVVQLFSPERLAAGYDPRTDDHITLWEVVLHLAKALDEEGLDAAGLMMSRASTRIDLDEAKELAYLTFSIANDRRWSGTAQLFNVLVASWADVVDAARRRADDKAEQLTLESTY